MIIATVAAGPSQLVRPVVDVVIVGGISSRQVPASRLYYSPRSRTLYARRHWRPSATALLIVLSLTLDPIARPACAAVCRRGREVVPGFAAFVRYPASLPSIVSVPSAIADAAPGRSAHRISGSDGG